MRSYKYDYSFGADLARNRSFPTGISSKLLVDLDSIDLAWDLLSMVNLINLIILKMIKVIERSNGFRHPSSHSQTYPCFCQGQPQQRSEVGQLVFVYTRVPPLPIGSSPDLLATFSVHLLPFLYVYFLSVRLNKLLCHFLLKIFIFYLLKSHLFLKTHLKFTPFEVFSDHPVRSHLLLLYPSFRTCMFCLVRQCFCVGFTSSLKMANPWGTGTMLSFGF